MVSVYRELRGHLTRHARLGSRGVADTGSRLDGVADASIGSRCKKCSSSKVIIDHVVIIGQGYMTSRRALDVGDGWAAVGKLELHGGGRAAARTSCDHMQH